MCDTSSFRITESVAGLNQVFANIRRCFGSFLSVFGLESRETERLQTSRNNQDINSSVDDDDGDLMREIKKRLVCVSTNDRQRSRRYRSCGT